MDNVTSRLLGVWWQWLYPAC